MDAIMIWGAIVGGIAGGAYYAGSARGRVLARDAEEGIHLVLTKLALYAATPALIGVFLGYLVAG
jgi:hypothetical protein